MTLTAAPELERLAPAVIDFEASGFGRGSYPIEVGFVRPDGQAWCSLIRPEPDWLHWEPTAAALHSIRRDDLLRHGRSPAEVVQQLNRQLQGQTVYCDGWAHDYAWMGRLYEAAGSQPTFRLDSLLALLDETAMARWDPLRQQVAQRMGLRRHRASADARILQQTWLALHRDGHG